MRQEDQNASSDVLMNEFLPTLFDLLAPIIQVRFDGVAQSGFGFFDRVAHRNEIGVIGTISRHASVGEADDNA